MLQEGHPVPSSLRAVWLCFLEQPRNHFQLATVGEVGGLSVVEALEEIACSDELAYRLLNTAPHPKRDTEPTVGDRKLAAEGEVRRLSVVEALEEVACSDELAYRLLNTAPSRSVTPRSARAIASS